ncbi:SLC13 family permease [Mangrovimicrobium sediminis]|uniref:SLC13 family permease n=1 Tax=Mangrovimicrobium sediminis TaxID=2562682 RepID=A0A4Z0LXB0_9GAMM|nr:SLC13 family permease [Haliea sp. SAOS-164]TGD71715.1 SLC13 family permease [Haliea sp. SAOS-164]
MEWQGWFSLGLTAITLALLVWGRLATEIVLCGAMAILSLSGVLATEQALAGFANPGLVTVALMFVVASGIQSTGGVDLLVSRVLGLPRSLAGARLRLVLPVIACSGFLNNTPIVAALIPAVHSWARRIGHSPSALLLPLSYAAILGGTLTMIGTSTNLVINGLYSQMTGDSFSLFAITPLGLAVALAGTCFMLLAFPSLLPPRRSAEEAFADPREYTVEVAVASDGPLVGRSIAAAGLRHLGSIYLVEIERDGQVLGAVAPQEQLRGGDRLVFAGDTDAIVNLQRINGLVPSTGEAPALGRANPERCLVEVVVSPHCECIGQTIRNSRFRERYEAVVLAVARGGERIPGNLGSIELHAADTLLLEARPNFVRRQAQARDFLLVSGIAAERPRHDRALLAWLILLAVVTSAALGLLSMLNAAFLGAGLMLLSRSCTPTQALRSLDLPVLLSIGASFALGAALEQTGAATLLAGQVLQATANPLAMLALTYLTTSILTEIITNNAAAVIMLPIVLAGCHSAGFNPEPFVVALMFGASASFATPIGYQTNLMVAGPGGYRFGDFLRAGIPLNLVCGAVTVAVIPYIWPLRAAL